MTEIVAWSADPGERLKVVQAVERELDGGRPVAGPTDTVYGILARSDLPAAVEAVRAIKGRNGPFILLARSTHDAQQIIGRPLEPYWSRLATQWPAPLTLIVKATMGTPLGQATVAIRVPDDAFLEAVLASVAAPLITTSANLPGSPTPVDAAGVVAELGDRIGLVVDGGLLADRAPSTLVDLSRRPPRVLRMGAFDPGPFLDRGTPPP